MAANRNKLSIPAPIKGMNVRETNSSSFAQAIRIVNMYAGKDDTLVRRPATRHYNYGFDFGSTKNYGLCKYINKDVVRMLAVNNGQIQEFTHGSTTNRIATSDDRYHVFAIGNGAVFVADGKGNRFKGVNDTWTKYGLRGPDTAPTVTQGTGGSLADGTYIIGHSHVYKVDGTNVITTASEYGTSTITISGGGGTASIEITNLRNPTDLFTHQIIWCTDVGGSTLYKSQEIAATVQSATITTAPTSGDDLSNYDDNYGIQGNVNWLEFADDAVWIVETDNPTQIKRSNRGTNYDNESFPITNVKEFATNGQSIVFCKAIGAHMYVMSAETTHRLPDYDLNATPEEVSEKIGTSHPWSWKKYQDGIIGRTNRGIEYFDGFNFHKMSDDIYQLIQSDTLKNSTQGGYAEGKIYDDPQHGPLYFFPARVASDVLGGVGDMPGYLPGSGTGGTGLGGLSDKFDNDSLNTTRWESTTGNATITEQNSQLELSKSDQSVEDVYLESKATMEESICLTVAAEITDNSGSAHDITQYLSAYLDGDNYVEVGYRDVNGTLSFRAKVAKAGVVTTTDVASVPSSTTFRIRVYHGRAEVLYKDAANAWTYVLADTYGWDQTGWAIRLGIRCDSASSDPTFDGTFKTLRAQFRRGTGLETVVDESFYVDTPNVALVAMLRGWSPGRKDEDGNLLQPPWFLTTYMPQRFVEGPDGELLYADDVQGKIFRIDNSAGDDDGEMVPMVLDTPALSSGKNSVRQYSTRADIVGSWGQPFKMILYCGPSKESHEKDVHGYGSGTAFSTNPFSSFSLANTQGIYKVVKYRKMVGSWNSFRVEKMDYDPTFEFENIEPIVRTVRGKR